MLAQTHHKPHKPIFKGYTIKIILNIQIMCKSLFFSQYWKGLSYTVPTSLQSYYDYTCKLWHISFHFDLHSLIKPIPQSPLLSLPHSYHYHHLSLYFLITTPHLTFFLSHDQVLFSVSPYHITNCFCTSPSSAMYINCSYFVVILQFVNSSQSKLLHLHTSL